MRRGPRYGSFWPSPRAPIVLLAKTGRTASLASFALTIALVAVLMRFIRLRWLVLAVALIPLVWPPLYQLRNDIRHTQLATYSATGQAPASQRLREDLNFARIEQLPEIPDASIHPGLSTELRFGLLPRFLDPGRSNLQTASQISVAEGGVITSSATLTTLGDAYALQGWPGVALFVVPLTLAMGIAVRRRSAWGYMFVAILIASGVWIESTYPDCLAAILQASVSLVVMGVLITVLRFSPRRAPSPVIAVAAAGSRTPAGTGTSWSLGTIGDTKRSNDLNLVDLWDDRLAFPDYSAIDGPKPCPFVPPTRAAAPHHQCGLDRQRAGQRGSSHRWPARGPISGTNGQGAVCGGYGLVRRGARGGRDRPAGGDRLLCRPRSPPGPGLRRDIPGHHGRDGNGGRSRWLRDRSDAVPRPSRPDLRLSGFVRLRTGGFRGG